MKTLLVGINAKYIHTNLAIRLLKVNSDYPVDIKEFTIKDDPDKVLEYVNQYDLVGFSCYIWNIEYIKALLKKIDRKVIVLLGGPEVSYNPKEYIDNFNVSYVIKNEGEIAFNSLLDALINGKPINHIQNLVTKDFENETCEIENLKLLKSPYYLPNDLKNRITYIETSRGCPFNCSYCLASRENTVRYFDLNTIKKDLLYLMENGAKVFKFLDRTFNLNKKHTLDLFSFIIENHYPNTSFQFEITGDILASEIIDYVNKHAPKNLIRFEIGVQTTNNLANSLVDRHQNIEKLFENIKKIRDANVIDLHLDLIAGLPNETYESFSKSFDEVISLRPLELQLGFLKFLKGTKLYSEIDLYDYKFQKDPPYEIISSKTLSRQELDKIRVVERVLEKYYNSQFMNTTINYILDNVTSPFNFFLDFGTFYEQNYSWFKYNLDDLFVYLINFLQKINFKNIDYCKFLLKYDYLKYFKIKPKIWWKRLSRKENNNLLRKLHSSILSNYSLDELYRYGIVERYENLYLFAIYMEKRQDVFIYEKK
ncbi:MAG TPA: DUF4080 domain-containing protein [Acholeplasmataceae bacterium]|nr:DUF4080 domain-containing protein [Acholeplasmataceae bacterium]